MGGYRQGPGEGDAVLQTLGPFDGTWGHPAAYGGQGGWVYVLESAGGGPLRALSYGLGGEGAPQLANAATSAETFGYTSGSPLVTSNGTTAGSAVVWVEYANGPNGGAAQLRAYAATPSEGVLPLLWSGKIGKASKFAVPTAYEGRVYVGTRGGQLIAFGSSANSPVQASGLELGSVEVGRSRTVTIPVSVRRELTLTGPFSTSGVEQAPPPAHVAKAGGHTAGPGVIKPSGTGPLSSGVIAIEQPPLGRAVPAGSTIPVRVRFTPRHAGAVVASLQIVTSAGTREVAISGYGSAPGLLLSAPKLALRDDPDRSRRQAGELHVLELLGPARAAARGARARWRVQRERAAAARHRARAARGLHRLAAVRSARAGSDGGRIVIVTDHGTATIAVSGRALTGRALLAVSSRRIDFGQVKVGRTQRRHAEGRKPGHDPARRSRARSPRWNRSRRRRRCPRASASTATPMCVCGSPSRPPRAGRCRAAT